MITDTAGQPLVDTNGQTLVTQNERHALIQKLAAKWPQDLSTKVENLAFEKSRGVKPVYFKVVQHYHQQIQAAYQNHANQQQQQQQQQQQALQSLNNNTGQFLNQQLNPPQQPSISMLAQPQLNHILNQQPRFPSVPQPLQPRMTNPQTSIVNTQSNVVNQVARLREPQKFNQSPLHTIAYNVSPHNSTPTPSSIPTISLSQNYTSQQQQQLNNTNLNDYLSQPLVLSNRYANQPRPRPTTNLNANFSQQSSSNNSNDILHQFVLGNPPTNPIVSSSTTTTSSNNSDRLLQKILSSNNDGPSNTISLANRQPSLQQPAPSIMPQPIRSASTANSNNNNNSVNSRRSSLISQQTSPSPTVIIMPTSTQTSNVQIQPSTNVTIQQSPLNNNNTNNNNNASFPINTQSMLQPPSSLSMNSSTPLLNNYSSPVNRSLPPSGSGSISSPDEETINLIKYLKENIGKLQTLCQKFTNEGNLDKARNAQAIHQQMVQFINNPTYESLPNARHIRDMLERASNRPPQSNPLPINVPISNPPSQQLNNINQFEQALTEYLSRDKRKRLFVSQLFVEPLNDVVNGVPHKKIRLDNDNNNSNRIVQQIRSPNPSSLLSHLNDELSLLPAKIFSIEYLPVSHVVTRIAWDDEYLSRKGMVLRCKLLESLNPLIPPLRIRISTRYPDEQPEILSLTETIPPKLEFTDGHPYFEQLSTLFISYIFKLPPRHTVTDILNIWRQSAQAAL